MTYTQYNAAKYCRKPTYHEQLRAAFAAIVAAAVREVRSERDANQQLAKGVR